MTVQLTEHATVHAEDGRVLTGRDLAALLATGGEVRVLVADPKNPWDVSFASVTRVTRGAPRALMRVHSRSGITTYFPLDAVVWARVHGADTYSCWPVRELYSPDRMVQPPTLKYRRSKARAAPRLIKMSELNRSMRTCVIPIYSRVVPRDPAFISNNDAFLLGLFHRSIAFTKHRTRDVATADPVILMRHIPGRIGMLADLIPTLKLIEPAGRCRMDIRTQASGQANTTAITLTNGREWLHSLGGVQHYVVRPRHHSVRTAWMFGSNVHGIPTAMLTANRQAWTMWVAGMLLSRYSGAGSPYFQPKAYSQTEPLPLAVFRAGGSAYATRLVPLPDTFNDYWVDNITGTTVIADAAALSVVRSIAPEFGDALVRETADAKERAERAIVSYTIGLIDPLKETTLSPRPSLYSDQLMPVWLVTTSDRDKLVIVDGVPRVPTVEPSRGRDNPRSASKATPRGPQSPSTG